MTSGLGRDQRQTVKQGEQAKGSHDREQVVGPPCGNSSMRRSIEAVIRDERLGSKANSRSTPVADETKSIKYLALWAPMPKRSRGSRSRQGAGQKPIRWKGNGHIKGCSPTQRRHTGARRLTAAGGVQKKKKRNPLDEAQDGGPGASCRRPLHASPQTPRPQPYCPLPKWTGLGSGHGSEGF